MIKQEMKIKLNLSELDTLRQKVFSAKERHKDIVEKASKFNDRIQQSEYRYVMTGACVGGRSSD